MALEVQFELWDGEPYTAGSATSTLSLLSYTNDIEVSNGGYGQVAADGQDGSVTEIITCRLKGSSHDDLAAKLQSLAGYIERARFGNLGNPYRYQVWMHVKLTNETKARYAYIYEIRTDSESFMTALTLGKSAVREYKILIRRAPYWEHKDYAALSLSDASPLLTGGTATITATAGDVAARMFYMSLTGTATGGIIANLWLGFIGANNYPDSANWLSTWGVDKAGALGADTTTAVDANCISGKSTRCTFATVTSMIVRALISVGDMYASGQEVRAAGKFLVLLRAKVVTGGDSVNIRMATSLVGSYSTNPYIYDRIKIDSTVYQYYEMGVVNFPLNCQPNYASNIARGDAIGIEAELLSATAALYLDSLIFIPVAEGYIKVTGADIEKDGPTVFASRYYTGDNVIQRGATYATDVIVNFQVFGGIPEGTSRLVVAGSKGSGESELTNELAIAIQAKCRWRELRGNA